MYIYVSSRSLSWTSYFCSRLGCLTFLCCTDTGTHYDNRAIVPAAIAAPSWLIDTSAEMLQISAPWSFLSGPNPSFPSPRHAHRIAHPSSSSRTRRNTSASSSISPRDLALRSASSMRSNLPPGVGRPTSSAQRSQKPPPTLPSSAAMSS